MAKSSAPDVAPGLVRVYPVPPANPTEYVRGIAAGGTDVPQERAASLLAAGLVTTTPPTAAEPDKE